MDVEVFQRPLYLLAAALLVPFVGWGVYALHCHYRARREWRASLEAATLVGVTLFFAVEVVVLRDLTREENILYVFALLGLLVAGVALYNHVAVSFVSRLVVDFVTHADEHAPDKPRLGPALFLERQRDYEGALNEYLILARIYPGNPTVQQHIAENLLQLERASEAAVWFERAFDNAESEQDALLAADRLSEIYERKLAQANAARAVYARFLKRFPRSQHAELVGKHVDRIGVPITVERDDSLEAMDGAAPVQAIPQETTVPEEAEEPPAKSGLVSLDTSPLAERNRGQEETADEARQEGPLEIESLDGHPLEEFDENDTA